MSLRLSSNAVRRFQTRSLARATTFPLKISNHNGSTTIRFAHGDTVIDQTKQVNHPNQPKKSEHIAAGNEAGSGKSDTSPAKQPEPQKPPGRATGFEREGPQGRAGEGKDTGDVHREKVD